MTQPPSRPQTVPKEHSANSGRLPGLCLACREPYKPQVYEDLCADCISLITADPDAWWDRFLALKMFDNLRGGHHHSGGRGNGH